MYFRCLFILRDAVAFKQFFIALLVFQMSPNSQKRESIVAPKCITDGDQRTGAIG